MNERLRQIDDLVLASHNQGKLDELIGLFEPLAIAVKSGIDLALDEPEETGDSFLANAELKALAALKATGRPSLADDSGLVVVGLDGEPGIHSARWAGSPRNFKTAMQRVVDGLAERFGSFDEADRRAYFTTVLCLAWPDGGVEFFEGRVDGRLVEIPRGSRGFGYDPIFVPDGMDRTFGEMEPTEKRALSHRTRAFDALIEGQPCWTKRRESLDL